MKSSGATMRGKPGPSRKSAPPSRFSGILRATGGALGAFARRKPGVVAAILAVVIGGGAFGWNVLTQQKGRHPAPLFASKPEPAPVEPPRRPQTLAAFSAPSGPVAPSAPVVPPPAARPEMPAAAPTSPPAVPLPVARPEASSRHGGGGDPIGALIRSQQEGGSRGQDGASRTLDSARVAAAQRALSKLGYGPLKPDGVMGAGTRQAIERFEREKNLPVSGALQPKTVKQLASLSGIVIE